MTRILVKPSTLRSAASTAASVASETGAAAGRIQGLPSPEGAPASAIGLLHQAAGQLRRSSASAGSEAGFLRAKAGQSALLDSPFGSGALDLMLPPLLSPWEMPPEPKEEEKKKKEPGGFKGFMKGLGEGGLDTVKSLAGTGAGVAGHMIDGDIGPVPNPFMIAAHKAGVPRLSDHVPLIGKARKQIDATGKYIYDHPGKAASETLDGMVAGQDRRNGNKALANGKVAFTLLTLLYPPEGVTAGAGSAATKSLGAVRAVGRAETQRVGAAAERKVAQDVKDAAQRRVNEGYARSRETGVRGNLQAVPQRIADGHALRQAKAGVERADRHLGHMEQRVTDATEKRAEEIKELKEKLRKDVPLGAANGALQQELTTHKNP